MLVQRKRREEQTTREEDEEEFREPECAFPKYILSLSFRRFGYKQGLFGVQIILFVLVVVVVLFVVAAQEGAAHSF